MVKSPEKPASGRESAPTLPCLSSGVGAHQGRLLVVHLPHRKRAFADEHSERLGRVRTDDVTPFAHASPDDAGPFEDISGRRTAFHREDHPGSIGSQFIRERADFAPKAVPPHAHFGAILINPARRAGTMPTQDACGLTQHLYLGNLAASRALSARSSWDERSCSQLGWMVLLGQIAPGPDAVLECPRFDGGSRRSASSKQFGGMSVRASWRGMQPTARGDPGGVPYRCFSPGLRVTSSTKLPLDSAQRGEPAEPCGSGTHLASHRLRQTWWWSGRGHA